MVVTDRFAQIYDFLGGGEDRVGNESVDRKGGI